MSIQDKIAKKLIREHGAVLDTRTASGWHLELLDLAKEDGLPPQYATCRVAFGKNQHTTLTCHVADNDELQIAGLQRFAKLADEEGMIFPYNEPRRASFHMGTVSFPIDIIFVGDDGRVTKKVENIEPGTRGFWGMPHVSAVIEVNGGFCAKNNIEVGCEVYELTEKTAQLYIQAGGLGFIPAFLNKQTGEVIESPGFHDVNLLPSNVDTDMIHIIYEDGFVDSNGKFYTRAQMREYVNLDTSEELYGLGEDGDLFDVSVEDRRNLGFQPAPKNAQESFPNYPRKDINPKMLPSNPTRNRFRDRDLVDEQVVNQPMSTYHQEQWGHDPSIDPDEENLTPNRPG